MGNMRTPIAATLLLLTASAYALQHNLEIRHREKNGVGYDEGYTSFDYFFTHSWKKPQILVNARAHLFNDARLASNIGIGTRYPIGNDACLVGCNFFYDYREVKHFPAHQVGAGLEFLSKRIDFRLNGYLPVGKSSHESRKFAGFSNHSILVLHKAQAALPVVEAEFGVPINRYSYLGLGPYYLFPRQADRFEFGHHWGGKARLDFKTNSPVSFGVAASYDPIFKTTVQGYISLKIPLGVKSKEKPLSRVLRDIPIARNEIIPIEKKKRTTPLYSDEENGVLVDFIFVNNAFSGAGNGTFEAPFSSLREAEKNSKPGDIIYVVPGDGTAHNMDEGITLQDGQVLAGSAAPLEIYGVEIPPLTPGEAPTITNVHPDEPIVTNPGESTLEGFRVVEPWEYLLENWSYDMGYDSGSYSVDAGIPSTDTVDLGTGEIVVSVDNPPPEAPPDTGNPDGFEMIDHDADTGGFEVIDHGGGDQGNGDHDADMGGFDIVNSETGNDQGAGNNPDGYESDGSWENLETDGAGTINGLNITDDHF